VSRSNSSPKLAFKKNISLSVVEVGTKVTVGLCVKNGAKVVQTAFDSISIQDYPHELMKLVIVDNNSSDNTLSLAVKFAQKTDIPTVVTSSKEGLGGTRQIAVNNAEGDYIIWVDDDFVLSKDYVRNQVNFMEKNPNVGAAKGLLKEYSDVHAFKGGLNIVNFTFLISSQQPVSHIGAGGAIFRLKALENVGGFDIRIKGAGEDIDISRRIKGSGWKLAVNKSAEIQGKHSPTTPKTLWKKNFWYGYANHFLCHKYKDQKLLLQYFPPIALLGGLRMARKIYRVTNMKKTFVFPIFHFFEMTVQSLGYIRAHLDGYGH
jgi:glycosyltransferase involved in cell wall biosynthesis